MTEYSDLVNALKATAIPFAEFDWKARPEGIHGVITPDMEGGSLDGDGLKQDRTIEVSIDVFCDSLTEIDTVEETVELRQLKSLAINGLHLEVGSLCSCLHQFRSILAVKVGLRSELCPADSSTQQQCYTP